MPYGQKNAGQQVEEQSDAAVGGVERLCLTVWGRDALDVRSGRSPLGSPASSRVESTLVGSQANTRCDGASYSRFVRSVSRRFRGMSPCVWVADVPGGTQVPVAFGDPVCVGVRYHWRAPTSKPRRAHGWKYVEWVLNTCAFTTCCFVVVLSEFWAINCARFPL